MPPSVLSLRTRVTSLLLFLFLSFILAPTPTPHLSFFLSIPHQVDPGPREGQPPGLVALSKAPQPPPPAPRRHEPSLPKNQAGVEAAQGGGGQEEVSLRPGLPLRLSHLFFPRNEPYPSSLPGSHSLVISLISESVLSTELLELHTPCPHPAPGSSPCSGRLGVLQLRSTLLTRPHLWRPESLLPDSPLACGLLLSVSVGLAPAPPVT